MSAMSRADVLRIVAEAREAGRRADLGGADLGGANLRRANLGYADLGGADLRRANLRYANLRYADLGYADLRYADLRYADLGGADLRRADLRYADLGGADLRRADLGYAAGAPPILQVLGLPSGDTTLAPWPDGWELRVGCWTGTPDTLAALIAGDDDWPEATGAEIDRRRPGLEALITQCRAWITMHPDAIEQAIANRAEFERLWADREARP